MRWIFYIDQTRRSIWIWNKKHLSHLKYGWYGKSSITKDAFSKNPNISITNLNLVKQINIYRFLNAAASIKIHKMFKTKITLFFSFSDELFYKVNNKLLIFQLFFKNKVFKIIVLFISWLYDHMVVEIALEIKPKIVWLIWFLISIWLLQIRNRLFFASNINTTHYKLLNHNKKMSFFLPKVQLNCWQIGQQNKIPNFCIKL